MNISFETQWSSGLGKNTCGSKDIFLSSVFFNSLNSRLNKYDLDPRRCKYYSRFGWYFLNLLLIQLPYDSFKINKNKFFIGTLTHSFIVQSYHYSGMEVVNKNCYSYAPNVMGGVKWKFFFLFLKDKIRGSGS